MLLLSKLKRMCKKKIKNVGKGNFHNLELDDKSKESIMNIGSKIFNQFDFDINIFVMIIENIKYG